MSLIFDALQRSEEERGGSGVAILPEGTELLQRLERNALLEWEHSTQFDAELLPAVTLSFNGKQPDLLTQFPSLQVSIAPHSQLVCLEDSESLAAEKFRFLGVRLRHLRRERPLQKVLITSTIPNEGKSMVSANLACVLARKAQQRVLLIEGDLRRPTLAQMFGHSNLPGICEWLQGTEKQAANLYHLEQAGLWLLPAGKVAGSPIEALQSARLTLLMEQLNSLFDWIIIDSPPILPLADTSVWSRLADGILLVARQGATAKRPLQRGLDAIDKKKVIGALMNSSRSAAHNDDYYYYKSYGSAGKGDRQ